MRRRLDGTHNVAPFAEVPQPPVSELQDTAASLVADVTDDEVCVAVTAAAAAATTTAAAGAAAAAITAPRDHGTIAPPDIACHAMCTAAS
jgi:hypothetical protein